MYDEVLGWFYLELEDDGVSEMYQKTHSWLRKTIYLTFFNRQEGDIEKSIEILRNLCRNQQYWQDIFTDYIIKNHKRYDKSVIKKEDLQLLEIYLTESNCKNDEYDGDFTFHFYDLPEGTYCAIQVEGTFEKGVFPPGIGVDWYWRGKLLDGLLSGETKPNAKITSSSINPMPYTGENK
ncbi:MAG: hypothetical protein FWD01_05175 [Defluviitaleaceae bacterium]|nr:hypothetical protein [Defluviitaleaceae bacterium]